MKLKRKYIIITFLTLVLLSVLISENVVYANVKEVNMKCDGPYKKVRVTSLEKNQEKRAYKEIDNNYDGWIVADFKKYLLVNDYLKSDMYKKNISKSWVSRRMHQAPQYKDVSSYQYDDREEHFYYHTAFYVTSRDFTKAEQKYLPKATVSQDGDIVTIKFENLKTYVNKLMKTGCKKESRHIWDSVAFSPIKACGYSGEYWSDIITQFNSNDDGYGGYGKIIEKKKWDYIKIDTSYSVYRGRVPFYVIIPSKIVDCSDFYSFASENGYGYMKDSTIVRTTYSYIACSTAVTCNFDKNKCISKIGKPFDWKKGKFIK